MNEHDIFDASQQSLESGTGNAEKMEEIQDSREVKSRPETMLNPRIQALMQERDAAEQKLQEAILDLESREQSPTFQKAEELAKEGWHVVNRKGFEEFSHLFLLPPGTTLKSLNRDNAYTYIPSGDNTIEALDDGRSIFKELNLDDGTFGQDVIKHLINLTIEDKDFVSE